MPISVNVTANQTQIFGHEGKFTVVLELHEVVAKFLHILKTHKAQI